MKYRWPSDARARVEAILHSAPRLACAFETCREDDVLGSAVEFCQAVLAELPSISDDDAKLIARWYLSAHFGGAAHYIKGKPATAAAVAAKRMTPRQLMERFGISRSYAYRLVKQAGKK